MKWLKETNTGFSLFLSTLMIFRSPPKIIPLYGTTEAREISSDDSPEAGTITSPALLRILPSSDSTYVSIVSITVWYLVYNRP